MHWRAYSESRGPVQGEVVLRYDPQDAADPYLDKRRREYIADGKAIIEKPLDPDIRPPRPASGG